VHSSPGSECWARISDFHVCDVTCAYVMTRSFVLHDSFFCFPHRARKWRQTSDSSSNYTCQGSRSCWRTRFSTARSQWYKRVGVDVDSCDVSFFGPKRWCCYITPLQHTGGNDTTCNLWTAPCRLKSIGMHSKMFKSLSTTL